MDSPDRAELIGLDHVVIAVDDLDRAVADYRALGFTVEPGGRHPGRSTHNALVVFDDGAYFELIAWTAAAPHERWWRVWHSEGEGLVDHALLPRDTSAAIAAARARGLATIEGPFDGGRLRPDGQRLSWQTARQATPELPFLCGDLSPRALRVPEGGCRRHANGAIGIAGLSLRVADTAASFERWQQLVGPGLTAEPGNDGSLCFVLGGTRFELRRNASGSAELDTRAQGLSRVVLRAAAPGLARALDTRLTHGAELVIEGAAG